MKDVVITIGCPFLPLSDGELLDEKATELTTGWATISCIGCEPTSLGGVQGVVDVVTCGPPAFWLFCFGGCGLGITVFLDLRIIQQV